MCVCMRVCVCVCVYVCVCVFMCVRVCVCVCVCTQFRSDIDVIWWSQLSFSYVRLHNTLIIANAFNPNQFQWEFLVGLQRTHMHTHTYTHTHTHTYIHTHTHTHIAVLVKTTQTHRQTHTHTHTHTHTLTWSARYLSTIFRRRVVLLVPSYIAAFHTHTHTHTHTNQLPLLTHTHTDIHTHTHTHTHTYTHLTAIFEEAKDVFQGGHGRCCALFYSVLHTHTHHTHR